MKLENECGVTQVSTENAQKLCKHFGFPDQIEFCSEGETSGHTVIFIWRDPPLKHQFNGFAWGYGGTGPNGLCRALSFLGICVDIREIAKWDQNSGPGFAYIRSPKDHLYRKVDIVDLIR